MLRTLRAVVAVLVLAPAPALVGCGPSKNEPNPDLQVPDIPPAGHGSKDVSKDKKADKADKADKKGK